MVVVCRHFVDSCKATCVTGVDTIAIGVVVAVGNTWARRQKRANEMGITGLKRQVQRHPPPRIPHTTQSTHSTSPSVTFLYI